MPRFRRTLNDAAWFYAFYVAGKRVHLLCSPAMRRWLFHSLPITGRFEGLSVGNVELNLGS
jgi:hypothetical protein